MRTAIVAAVLFAFPLLDNRFAHGQALINEVVTDPQRDWNDSAGGNGIRFDSQPGAGTISDSDEWVEILNVSSATLNLSGWQLVMIDTTPATETLGAGSADLVFSAGSSLEQFPPGGRLVIGNPVGAMNNSILLILRDPAGQIIDTVEFGTGDFAGDGSANNAPGGNAGELLDEAVARVPDGIMSGDPSRDFRKTVATISAINPDLPPFALVLINEVVTDPQHDWSDSSGGNGVAFDDAPGTGTISDVDEWVELVNTSRRTISLAGWRLVMIDTSPATETLGAGSATLRFESGGSIEQFAPNRHAVIGNPAGAMNNAIWLQLFDREGRLVDQVELGMSDFRGTGVGDEAPDGNATSLNNEAVARWPEAARTGHDEVDFRKAPATIGRSNSPTAARAWRWMMYE